MFKNGWLKWSLLLAGSTVAVFQLGACISKVVLPALILSWAD